MSADPRRHLDAHLDQRESSRALRALVSAAAAVLAAVGLLAILVPTAGALPAGRGYEKVSPNDKDGQDMIGGGVKAAVNGDATTSTSFGAFGDSEGAGLLTSFHSARTATDWGTNSLGPPQEVFPSLASSLYQDFSDDVCDLDRRVPGRRSGSRGRHPRQQQHLPAGRRRVDAPALAQPARAPAGGKSSRRSPT